ncbi:MAG: ABC transporter ATP-binding protein [Candidatus Bathyarchaeia archaeon]|jgi:peptide/nickel transport system ATP-binding protein
MALLDIKNLTTYYETKTGTVKAVENVSFPLEKKQAIGLAGESGCGKTTIALSLLKILPREGKIINGQIIFEGKDIIKLDESEMRKNIRWKGIALIFQGAMNALNPVYKVKDQIIEAIQIHEPETTKKEALERAEKLFQVTGLDPSRLDNYPHEYSGGMKQRACIAMALACNPKVLIADEPSTALDVIVQAQILKLLKDLKEKLSISLIVISHDLSLIAETCDTAAIMYAGKVVELADIVKIFKHPLHPYTQGLIEAFPSISSKDFKLVSIPGNPPDLINPPPGCRFHPRCKYAMEICKRENPKFKEISNGHYVSCHLVGGQ